MRNILIALALCAAAPAAAQPLPALFSKTIVAHAVVPTPQSLTAAKGSLVISRALTAEACGAAGAALRLLEADVLAPAGGTLSAEPENGTKAAAKARRRADLTFATDTTLAPEAYRISVSPRAATVCAADARGFIHAVQTLRQLATRDAKGVWRWPACDIADAPRMAWRALMLDSGRQYQRPETIRKYIDLAALLKLNRLHWHLTEGLGWRVEIKKYPRLAAEGSRVAAGAEQQGFYSQAEIRDLVAYAAARGIDIVPEIDIPGHAEAALHVYPQYGCFGEVATIPASGFTPQIFCAGKDATVRFLCDVLDEVCQLFPSRYIHLGGDEAPKDNWQRCPDCQRRIQAEGLTDEHELQRWLAARMAEWLAAKGRTAILWEDALYPGHAARPATSEACGKNGATTALPRGTVVQWWNYRGHRDRALRLAAQAGCPVIASPNYYTYLNFPTAPWEGYGPERTFSFADAYQRNPADSVAAGAAAGEGGAATPEILGMTAALWTDYGLTERLLDTRLLPRLLALAQQMWHTGPAVPYDDFLRLVDNRRPWLEGLGYDFGPM